MAGKKRPRLALDKERVFTTAVNLADEEGVAALTMRSLAVKLGVEAMSLYYHVASKEQILDGMVDLVFGEIDLPRNTSWKTAMRKRAHSVRAALRRHAWALGLMESRRSPGLLTLHHHDAVIGCLRRAGFSIAEAAHAFSALDSYIYGFVMQEQNRPFQSSDELELVAETMRQHLRPDQFPYMTEMIVKHALKPGYAYANEFVFGLELILDGLERLRGRSSARKRAKS